MARINKANNDGSISIIIPKSVRKINGWVPGQNVEIKAVNPACILLYNEDVPHKFSKIENIDELMKHINQSIVNFNAIFDVVKNIEKHETVLSMDEEQFRDMLRQYLLGLMERI